MTQHKQIGDDSDSTRTVIKEAMSQLADAVEKQDYQPSESRCQKSCPYKNDPDSFDRKFDVCYNQRILKIILGFGGATLGVAGVVLAAWISLQSEIAVIKERQNGYQQVLTELKEIRTEITDLKIKIAQSNNKGTP